MQNLLHIDEKNQVKLSNIAELILNYDLSKKSPEQLRANYLYVYKVFARLGLCDIKKNISGKTKIPLHFVTKLLEELQKDPDKFNQTYVKDNVENKKFYSANYCYKLLQEINVYKQQNNITNTANNDEESIQNFIKNPLIKTFPRNINNYENLVSIIKNLSPEYHINFKYLFPHFKHIFYIYLSNIFYSKSQNKMVLEVDKLYYIFKDKNDINSNELSITNIVNFTNSKLNFYGWNNAEIRFINNGNLKHVKILFSNQPLSSDELNFGDLVCLNFKNSIANIFTEDNKNKICLFKKFLQQETPKNQLIDDISEILINNILSQMDFNNKVIEFLKDNKLLTNFFDNENKEIYNEVIANLYNLQIMYNHLKEIQNNGFLIDKIF